MKSGIFAFEGYTLDLARACLRACGDEIKLRPKCLDLLQYLVENPGRLLLKDELAEAVWPNVIVSDDSLAQCISDLRNALGDVDRRIIKTVTRRGYLFAAAVSILPAQDPIPLPALPSRLSMVVLPFENLSGDPDQDHFVDAITDDLTTDLSRISGAFVIARHTAFTYKGKPVNAKQVGGELGVRYVLEGSVRRITEQVRVNVQLVDAENGAHVWADRFDIHRADIAQAQDEITGRLARTLNLELIGAAGHRIEQGKAADPDAHGLVMRGWAYYYRPVSIETRQEAQRLFEAALKLDPESVDARIGIGRILVGYLGDGWSNAFQNDLARAEQLLVEALERDPNRSMAHEAMGMVRRGRKRFMDSKMEFEVAVSLDRNNARALLQLGRAFMFLGEPAAAVPLIERAMRLNPYDPNSSDFYRILGFCRLFLGQIDEAVDLLRRGCAANPRFWYAHLYLAATLGFRGDLEEARIALAESLKLKPQVNSLARLIDEFPWITHPPYWALLEKTVNVGLRRAGFPDD